MINFNISGKYRLKPQAINSEPAIFNGSYQLKPKAANSQQIEFDGKYKLKPSPPSRQLWKPGDPLVPSFPTGRQTIFDDPCFLSGRNLVFLYEGQWAGSESSDDGVSWSLGSYKFFYYKGKRTYTSSQQSGLQMNFEVPDGFNYTLSSSSSGTSYWHYTSIPKIILDAIKDGETGGSSTSSASEVSYGTIGRTGWYLFYGMVTYTSSNQTSWSFSCSHS